MKSPQKHFIHFWPKSLLLILLRKIILAKYQQNISDEWSAERSWHHFTVTQPLKPGKDNTHTTINCIQNLRWHVVLYHDNNIILIYRPALMLRSCMQLIYVVFSHKLDTDSWRSLCTVERHLSAHLWLISPELQSAGLDVSPVSYILSQNGDPCLRWQSRSVCVWYTQGPSIMEAAWRRGVVRVCCGSLSVVSQLADRPGPQGAAHQRSPIHQPDRPSCWKAGRGLADHAWLALPVKQKLNVIGLPQPPSDVRVFY